MGTVELDLPDAPEGVQKPSATEISSPFGPKPEITHIFRQADKRAPSSLSTAFLVLTLLPLLGFLVGVITDAPTYVFYTVMYFSLTVFLFHIDVLTCLSYVLQLKFLDINVKLFPKSGLPTIAALCFHAGIASILGLYVLFWLKVSNFIMLRYMSKHID